MPNHRQFFISKNVSNSSGSSTQGCGLSHSYGVILQNFSKMYGHEVTQQNCEYAVMQSCMYAKMQESMFASMKLYKYAKYTT